MFFRPFGQVSMEFAERVQVALIALRGFCALSELGYLSLVSNAERVSLMGAMLCKADLRGRLNHSVDILLVLSFLPLENDSCAFFLHMYHPSTRSATPVFFKQGVFPGLPLHIFPIAL